MLIHSLHVPSHVPSHPQTGTKVRGFSLAAPGFTAETDCLLEGNGFELSVRDASPPRTVWPSSFGDERRLLDLPATAVSIYRGPTTARMIPPRQQSIRPNSDEASTSLPISRGTESSNPSPATRESGEVGGSSRSVAHRYLQLHAIVRTQLGGPPTVAGFKVLISRLQPRAETMRPEGVRRPHGIVHEELPFRDGLG